MPNHSEVRVKWAAFIATVLFFFPLISRADDFEGAAGLIKKLNDLQAPPASTGTAAASSQDSAAQLLKDLTSFTQQSSILAPEKAARAWLDLFERGLKLQVNSGQMAFSGSAARAVFSALPGPAAWPSLQKLVAAGVPDQQANPAAWAGLRLITHTLTDKEDQQWSDLAAMASLQPTSMMSLASMSGQTGGAFLSVGTALSDVSGQPDEVEKFWDTELSRLEQATATNGAELALPDLVTLLGQERARPLILRALLLPSEGISSVEGVATQALARQLALANVDKLHLPPWCLTQSLDGAPLYEALRKKFPADDGGQAYAIYYVIALVTQGRADEAAKADVDIDMSELEDATAQAANAGWGPQVYDFVHSYLGLHPDSDLWEFYIDLAAQTGHAHEALKFVQETNARPGLSSAAHEQIRAVLYRGLLAVDQVDEGIAQLRALIKSGRDEMAKPPAPSPPAISINNIGSVSTQVARQMAIFRRAMRHPDPAQKVVEWDLALARLGHLLKRDDLESEGLDDAVRIVENPAPPPPESQGFPTISYTEERVSSYEIETGRYAQAEKLIIDEIVRDAKKSQNTKVPGFPLAGQIGTGVYSYQSRQNLLELALDYYEAGRWTDILTLLQDVPGWGAKDLAEIATEGSYLTRRSTPHLDLIAARALAETGHVDAALPILDYALQEDPGNDAAYGLLLKVGPGDLTAKLDALYREDQFQERPLIWKAVVLLQQGKVDDAENACKAAIAVDPSDGEEGKGDRMRVYSVMADVCDAKKDPQQAAFFRNVVKAIRLSEDADDYYDAGLLTRAVGMYAHALTLFSDAYCIQSRIARQLAELGRLDEAAVHYRKAFELMPVSFGRLESHCFGCERAFQGKTAVTIAEDVFTKMMAKDPKKPQIPYLLGYLYMEEKRYPEALANFQKAAQLDPDYINAWRHIAEIGEEYQLSPALRDDAVLNLLRLDPAGRHVKPNTDRVRQLDKLWQAEEKAAEAVPPLPTTLLVLTASAAQPSLGTGTSAASLLQMSGLSGMNPEMTAWIQLQQMGMLLGRDISYAKGRGVSPLEAVLANKVIAGALDYL